MTTTSMQELDEQAMVEITGGSGPNININISPTINTSVNHNMNLGFVFLINDKISNSVLNINFSQHI